LTSQLPIRILSSEVSSLAAKVAKVGSMGRAPCLPATVAAGIVTFSVFGTGILSGAFVEALSPMTSIRLYLLSIDRGRSSLFQWGCRTRAAVENSCTAVQH
jgi:hypothetical protein